MIELDQTLNRQNEAFYERRKKEILEARDERSTKGKVYYVSADGADDNDGTTPEAAWKTLDRVNGSYFIPGDSVLFRRGDLFRGGIQTQIGVTYGAFGKGDKPRFYGWDKNLADALLWEEVDAKHHIFRYVERIPDVGTLVFNDGEKHARKLIPSYKNLQFVCREDESRIFVMAEEMTENLDLFWRFDEILTQRPAKGENFPIPVTGEDCYGELYVRCDDGNPGEVFDSIEAVVFRMAFRVGKNEQVKIDNLCMKYFCFGVWAGGHCKGLHVTNCEIGWIGGNIQHYYGTDPNYPEGRRGTVTRFGNGIEIYGGCEDYLVSGCYIYQVYDAAITHQVTTSSKILMKGIRYTNNLIEKCVYGVEYFLDQIDGESESFMEDVEISGNIIRLSGYGWGQQRHNKETPALIKGWSYVNTARNFTICHNLFDRSAYRMLHLVALKDAFCPKMHDNTYIQYIGGMLGQYGGNERKEPDSLVFDKDVEQSIKTILKDEHAKVYAIV